MLVLVSVQVQKVLQDARLLFVWDLPAASLTSFFTDAAGCYPGGVWYRSLRYVTARPATKAPVTSLYLRVVAARRPPMTSKDQQRTYRNLCCTWYADFVPLRHFTDCRDGVLTGQVPRSVRQV